MLAPLGVSIGQESHLPQQVKHAWWNYLSCQTIDDSSMMFWHRALLIREIDVRCCCSNSFVYESFGCNFLLARFTETNRLDKTRSCLVRYRYFWFVEEFDDLCFAASRTDEILRMINFLFVGSHHIEDFLAHYRCRCHVYRRELAISHSLAFNDRNSTEKKQTIHS
jgi:hypothetical protein